MTGNNKIELNQATMQSALQHYFDTVLFAEGKAPKVGWICEIKGNSTFIVDISDKQPTKGNTK